MIPFAATIQIDIEVELPDEFFLDDVNGHVITASDYITKHINEYREHIMNADAHCIRAIATEEDE